MPDHPTTPGAVFLSYAREDTDAVRRITDALRAFGFEVWFDQNELRGGDVWDARIRAQIRTCTLCVPVISASTQARGEGYFRREWKIAVERTHDMAAGVPFLLPVVIDDTKESEALVPDEFMRVQWTRLAHGVPTPQFVEQVKKLLEGPRKPAVELGRSRSPVGGPAEAGRPGSATLAPTKGISGWLWGVGAAVLVAVVAGVIIARKPAPAAQPPSSSAEAKPAPAVLPVVSAKSIAVLPFANFSPDKDNEFFADGMHDEVITALAKIHDLTVISRTSVMAYKNPEGRNLKKIAADLGVANVLEGSVQRAGNQVKVIVQLIDARTDRHLWAQSYVENLTDVFTIQSKLADAITTALQAALSPEEKSLIARRPTENQEAYELYLRARILDQNLAPGATKEEYERVLGLYERAAVTDPAFALPHVQASILHGTMYWFAGLDATPARRAKALAEVDAAKRLAPAAPETLLAQGSFDYTCRNDWAMALAEYRAAEASLPNDAQLNYEIGLAHRRLGQWPEALARLERAAVLDPNDSGELIQLTATVFFMRRYPQVLDLTNRYLALFPDESVLQEIRIRARYALDGDRAAFLRAWAALPAAANDANGLFAAYIVAMIRGDLAAADRVLADPRMTSVVNLDSTINDPVDLHRAYVAWLRERPDEARRFADEAIATYRRQQWVPRQEPWVQLGIARAEAYAGRMDDALRDGKAALDTEIARDALSTLDLRNEYGRILVVGNRREEAIAILREMMSAPCNLSSNDIRFDPLWSRLKDDPRFEEILKSAKPL